MGCSLLPNGKTANQLPNELVLEEQLLGDIAKRQTLLKATIVRKFRRVRDTACGRRRAVNDYHQTKKNVIIIST